MTGKYDNETAARVRGVQKRKGRKQTGAVDKDTAKDLGPKPAEGQRPDWFEGDCGLGCTGPCVAKVRTLLHQPNLPVDFDQDLEAAVRRFQSANGLKLTGVVDEKTAIALDARSV